MADQPRTVRRPSAGLVLTVAVAGLAWLAGCGGSGPAAAPSVTPTAGTPTAGTPTAGTPTAVTPTASGATGLLPRPAHTVVVVMENHSYAEIIGNPAAPFINGLARDGALFTRSHGVTHPSEPNYLALFSGSTHGVTGDGCPYTFSAPNLATALIGAGQTFTGYAEDLPAVGSPVCSAGQYARKHVPWADFSNVPSSASRPFASFPSSDLGRLPTVAFVIPNLCDDMHDCGVAAGDTWLRTRLGAYVTWAMSHDSLLILTWDENDGSPGNQIPTIFVGPMVRPGRYAESISHYNVLATIEAAYGLPRTGIAATARPITGIWRP